MVVTTADTVLVPVIAAEAVAVKVLVRVPEDVTELVDVPVAVELLEGVIGSQDNK